MRRRYRMEAQELAAAEALGPDRVAPTPRPAAGVVLAREVGTGPEVLLVRRRSDVGFAAGAYVFPGGTLDDEDADPAWSDFLTPPPKAALVGVTDAAGPSAIAFVVAALREMFEETGVLLVKGSAPDPAMLADSRAALVAGEKRFLDIVEEAEIRLAADDLVLCARWITPESLSRRYDARFFLTEAPPESSVTAESGELVEHAWMAPEEALQRYFDFEISMLFPTAKTLAWLAEGDSVAAWRRYFLGREIRPILPRLRRSDGDVIPVMPDDPRYDERDGDG